MRSLADPSAVRGSVCDSVNCLLLRLRRTRRAKLWRARNASRGSRYRELCRVVSVTRHLPSSVAPLRLAGAQLSRKVTLTRCMIRELELTWITCRPYSVSLPLSAALETTLDVQARRAAPSLRPRFVDGAMPSHHSLHDCCHKSRTFPFRTDPHELDARATPLLHQRKPQLACSRCPLLDRRFAPGVRNAKRD